MKRFIGFGALLLLLVTIAGGGLYLYNKWFGVPLPWHAAPVPDRPAESIPEDLPAPDLAGDSIDFGGGVVATLARFERNVKTKRADELSWESAKRQLPLYDNDAIRTFDRSTATINFGKNDVVEVDQNSLVVIRPRSTDGIDGEISLALLSADFLDSLTAQSAEERQAALQRAAEGREIRIRSASRADGRKGKSRIRVKALADNSTSLASLEGDLKLIGPTGKEILLKEKMVTKVTPQGTLMTPRKLPAAPTLLRPKNGATYSFLRKAPSVDLKWKQADRAASYRVLVARDQRFRKVYADERVKGTSFTIRNLQPGTYFWRVRSRDQDGFEGAYSRVRTVKAIRDERPPQLTIVSPPEMFVSPGPTVELVGKTDGGARVRIDGQPVKVASDGSFRHVITLREGINLINVEAVDAAGNTEYGKRLITYKGAKRSHAGVTGNQ